MLFQSRRNRKGLGSKKPQRAMNRATWCAGKDASAAAAANAQDVGLWLNGTFLLLSPDHHAPLPPDDSNSCTGAAPA